MPLYVLRRLRANMKDLIYWMRSSAWLLLKTLQQAGVRSQHPPTKRHLRGDRKQNTSPKPGFTKICGSGSWILFDSNPDADPDFYLMRMRIQVTTMILIHNTGFKLRIRNTMREDETIPRIYDILPGFRRYFTWIQVRFCQARPHLVNQLSRCFRSAPANITKN